MRQLMLLLIAITFSLPSFAQQCSNKIKSITVRDDGGYAVPYNDIHATWTKNMNSKMIDKVWDLYNSGKQIKQIESKSDGGYVILWDRNKAQWSDIPDELADKILELNKKGNEIKHVSMRDDGAFVMLWDRNDAIWTTDVPQKLIDKILELNKNGNEIKQVTMTDNGDYVILWDKNQAQWTTTIPSALSDKILELNKNGNTIDFVELTDENEFVIVWDDSHSYYSNGIPDNLKKKLRELSCYQDDNKSVAKPSVQWEYPTESVTYVTNKLQTVKACIKSEVDVDEVKLYLNGNLYETSRDFVIKKSSGSNCAVNFTKSIYLKSGDNTIEIVATNAGGTTTSYSRTFKVKEKEIVDNNNNNNDNVAVAKDRVALIIGNANYADANAVLRNPKNDADAMENRLKMLGFKVIKATDASKSLMREKIREFGQELQNNKVGLFYYAGHGFQIDGKNYLVPIDAHIEDQADAEDACVSIDYLLGKMDVAGSETNLVILDACRNNPFRSWSRSSNSGGLSSLSRQPLGSLIAFATQPGNVAADGSGSNGLYTSAWLQHLKKGANIYEVLTNINQMVSTSSGEKQVPWFNSSLQGMFVF